MILRIATGLVRLLAGLAAGFFIVALVAAWMLSRGPVSLGFVERHIANSLHAAFPTVEVEFDDAILVWAGWSPAIDIRIVNLRMTTTDGQVRAEVPVVSLSMSTQALLRGIAAPSRLELIDPTLSISRKTGGDFNLAVANIGAIATGRMETFLRQLSAPPDPDDPLSYLNTFLISNANIFVEETATGGAWVTPDAQLRIVREDSRIDVDISLLVDLAETAPEISIVGSYDGTTERVDAGVSFSSIVPAELASSAPELRFLEHIRFPVQGTLIISSSLDGQLDGVGFDIIGGAGSLSLPTYLGGEINVSSLVLRGQFDAVEKQIDIAEFTADLPQGSEIRWPAPIDHSFPLGSVKLSGLYAIESDFLQIDRLDLELDGVNLAIGGTVATVSAKPEIDLSLDVPFIDVSRLETYWPAIVLGDVYNWVTDNITKGNIENLHAGIATEIADDGSLIVTDVHGGFSVSDVTLTYVDTMPPVTHGAAAVTFNQESLEFDISSAQSAGMIASQARVSFLNISSNNERVKIRARVSSDFATAMALADRDPLNFATQAGIDVTSVSGTAVVDLAVDFPLLNNLTWPDVTASATAVASSVEIPNGLFGFDVHGGEIEIAIDRDGMDLSGEMLLETFPTILVWRQNFFPDASFKNHYKLSTHVTDIGAITDLGIDVSPFLADMIKGAVPLSIQMTEQFDGTARLEGAAVLDFAKLGAPAINWQKEPGMPGHALVSIDLIDNRIAAVPEFVVQTDDLVVSGNALYSEPGGRLSRIELIRVKYGRNDMSGLLVPGEGGVWDADFRGASLDLTPIWEDVIYGDLLTSGESFLKNVGLSVEFDRVWLSEERGVDNLSGTFSRRDDLWNTIYVTANVDSGESLEIKLAPSEESNARILTVWSLDAGSVLRTLDIYDNMVGGELTLTGQFDDALPDQPLKATLDVQDYRVVRAPVLAKIISIMALTGILDSLQGEGLVFDQLVLPFTYRGGILDLRDARATGASLGVTASGKVYTHTDAVDINGTIVPFYILNFMLGNIPVLGDLFSGGEEGGGLLAVNYSMTGSRRDPDVAINPLSVLTLGLFRNILNLGKMFDLGDDQSSGALSDPEN